MAGTIIFLIILFAALFIFLRYRKKDKKTVKDTIYQNNPEKFSNREIKDRDKDRDVRRDSVTGTETRKADIEPEMKPRENIVDTRNATNRPVENRFSGSSEESSLNETRRQDSLRNEERMQENQAREDQLRENRLKDEQQRANWSSENRPGENISDEDRDNEPRWEETSTFTRSTISPEEESALRDNREQEIRDDNRRMRQNENSETPIRGNTFGDQSDQSDENRDLDSRTTYKPENEDSLRETRERELREREKNMENELRRTSENSDMPKTREELEREARERFNRQNAENQKQDRNR